MTPVVLLHASGSAGTQWRGLAARLAPSFRVFAPDLIGYGRTPPWSGRADSFTLAHEAALLGALLARLDAPAHLVGHSYGGAVALHVARTRPEWVRSLTLVEPLAFHLLRDGDAVDLAALREIQRLAATVFRALELDNPRKGFGRFVDYCGGAGTWAVMEEARRASLAPLLGKVALDFQAVLGESGGRAALRDIAAPTLVVQAEHAPLAMRRICRLLASGVPGARLAMARGAGRLLAPAPWEEADALIEQHLRGGPSTFAPVAAQPIAA